MKFFKTYTALFVGLCLVFVSAGLSAQFQNPSATRVETGPNGIEFENCHRDDPRLNSTDKRMYRTYLRQALEKGAAQLSPEYFNQLKHQERKVRWSCAVIPACQKGSIAVGNQKVVWHWTKAGMGRPGVVSFCSPKNTHALANESKAALKGMIEQIGKVVVPPKNTGVPQPTRIPQPTRADQTPSSPPVTPLSIKKLANNCFIGNVYKNNAALLNAKGKKLHQAGLNSTGEPNQVAKAFDSRGKKFTCTEPSNDQLCRYAVASRGNWFQFGVSSGVFVCDPFERHSAESLKLILRNSGNTDDLDKTQLEGSPWYKPPKVEPTVSMAANCYVGGKRTDDVADLTEHAKNVHLAGLGNGTASQIAGNFNRKYVFSCAQRSESACRFGFAGSSKRNWFQYDTNNGELFLCNSLAKHNRLTLLMVLKESVKEVNGRQRKTELEGSPWYEPPVTPPLVSMAGSCFKTGNVEKDIEELTEDGMMVHNAAGENGRARQVMLQKRSSFNCRVRVESACEYAALHGGDTYLYGISGTQLFLCDDWDEHDVASVGAVMLASGNPKSKPKLLPDFFANDCFKGGDRNKELTVIGSFFKRAYDRILREEGSFAFNNGGKVTQLSCVSKPEEWEHCKYVYDYDGKKYWYRVDNNRVASMCEVSGLSALTAANKVAPFIMATVEAKEGVRLQNQTAPLSEIHSYFAKNCFTGDGKKFAGILGNHYGKAMDEETVKINVKDVLDSGNYVFNCGRNLCSGGQQKSRFRSSRGYEFDFYVANGTDVRLCQYKNLGVESGETAPSIAFAEYLVHVVEDNGLGNVASPSPSVPVAANCYKGGVATGDVADLKEAFKKLHEAGLEVGGRYADSFKSKGWTFSCEQRAKSECEYEYEQEMNGLSDWHLFGLKTNTMFLCDPIDDHSILSLSMLLATSELDELPEKRTLVADERQVGKKVVIPMAANCYKKLDERGRPTGIEGDLKDEFKLINDAAKDGDGKRNMYGQAFFDTSLDFSCAIRDGGPGNKCQYALTRKYGESWIQYGTGNGELFLCIPSSERSDERPLGKHSKLSLMAVLLNSVNGQRKDRVKDDDVPWAQPANDGEQNPPTQNPTTSRTFNDLVPADCNSYVRTQYLTAFNRLSADNKTRLLASQLTLSCKPGDIHLTDGSDICEYDSGDMKYGVSDDYELTLCYSFGSVDTNLLSRLLVHVLDNEAVFPKIDLMNGTKREPSLSGIMSGLCSAIRQEWYEKAYATLTEDQRAHLSESGYKYSCDVLNYNEDICQSSGDLDYALEGKLVKLCSSFSLIGEPSHLAQMMLVSSGYQSAPLSGGDSKQIDERTGTGGNSPALSDVLASNCGAFAKGVYTAAYNDHLNDALRAKLSASGLEFSCQPLSNRTLAEDEYKRLCNNAEFYSGGVYYAILDSEEGAADQRNTVRICQSFGVTNPSEMASVMVHALSKQNELSSRGQDTGQNTDQDPGQSGNSDLSDLLEAACSISTNNAKLAKSMYEAGYNLLSPDQQSDLFVRPSLTFSCSPLPENHANCKYDAGNFTYSISNRIVKPCAPFSSRAMTAAAVKALMLQARKPIEKGKTDVPLEPVDPAQPRLSDVLGHPCSDFITGIYEKAYARLDEGQKRTLAQKKRVFSCLSLAKDANGCNQYKEVVHPEGSMTYRVSTSEETGHMIIAPCASISAMNSMVLAQLMIDLVDEPVLKGTSTQEGGTSTESDQTKRTGQAAEKNPADACMFNKNAEINGEPANDYYWLDAQGEFTETSCRYWRDGGGCFYGEGMSINDAENKYRVYNADAGSLRDATEAEKTDPENAYYCQAGVGAKLPVVLGGECTWYDGTQSDGTVDKEKAGLFWLDAAGNFTTNSCTDWRDAGGCIYIENYGYLVAKPFEIIKDPKVIKRDCKTGGEDSSRGLSGNEDDNSYRSIFANDCFVDGDRSKGLTPHAGTLFDYGYIRAKDDAARKRIRESGLVFSCTVGRAKEDLGLECLGTFEDAQSNGGQTFKYDDTTEQVYVCSLINLSSPPAEAIKLTKSLGAFFDFLATNGDGGRDLGGSEVSYLADDCFDDSYEEGLAPHVARIKENYISSFNTLSAADQQAVLNATDIQFSCIGRCGDNKQEFSTNTGNIRYGYVNASNTFHLCGLYDQKQGDDLAKAMGEYMIGMVNTYSDNTAGNDGASSSTTFTGTSEIIVALSVSANGNTYQKKQGIYYIKSKKENRESVREWNTSEPLNIAFNSGLVKLHSGVSVNRITGSNSNNSVELRYGSTVGDIYLRGGNNNARNYGARITGELRLGLGDNYYIQDFDEYDSSSTPPHTQAIWSGDGDDTIYIKAGTVGESNPPIKGISLGKGSNVVIANNGAIVHVVDWDHQESMNTFRASGEGTQIHIHKPVETHGGSKFEANYGGEIIGAAVSEETNCWDIEDEHIAADRTHRRLSSGNTPGVARIYTQAGEGGRTYTYFAIEFDNGCPGPGHGLPAIRLEELGKPTPKISLEMSGKLTVSSPIAFGELHLVGNAVIGDQHSQFNGLVEIDHLKLGHGDVRVTKSGAHVHKITLDTHTKAELVIDRDSFAGQVVGRNGTHQERRLNIVDNTGGNSNHSLLRERYLDFKNDGKHTVPANELHDDHIEAAGGAVTPKHMAHVHPEIANKMSVNGIPYGTATGVDLRPNPHAINTVNELNTLNKHATSPSEINKTHRMKWDNIYLSPGFLAIDNSGGLSYFKNEDGGKISFVQQLMASPDSDFNADTYERTLHLEGAWNAKGKMETGSGIGHTGVVDVVFKASDEATTASNTLARVLVYNGNVGRLSIIDGYLFLDELLYQGTSQNKFTVQHRHCIAALNLADKSTGCAGADTSIHGNGSGPLIVPSHGKTNLLSYPEGGDYPGFNSTNTSAATGHTAPRYFLDNDEYLISYQGSNTFVLANNDKGGISIFKKATPGGKVMYKHIEEIAGPQPPLPSGGYQTLRIGMVGRDTDIVGGAQAEVRFGGFEEEHRVGFRMTLKQNINAVAVLLGLTSEGGLYLFAVDDNKRVVQLHNVLSGLDEKNCNIATKFQRMIDPGTSSEPLVCQTTPVTQSTPVPVSDVDKFDMLTTAAEQSRPNYLVEGQAIENLLLPNQTTVHFIGYDTHQNLVLFRHPVNDSNNVTTETVLGVNQNSNDLTARHELKLLVNDVLTKTINPGDRVTLKFDGQFVLGLTIPASFNPIAAYAFLDKNGHLFIAAFKESAFGSPYVPDEVVYSVLPNPNSNFSENEKNESVKVFHAAFIRGKTVPDTAPDTATSTPSKDEWTFCKFDHEVMNKIQDNWKGFFDGSGEGQNAFAGQRGCKLHFESSAEIVEYFNCNGDSQMEPTPDRKHGLFAVFAAAFKNALTEEVHSSSSPSSDHPSASVFLGGGAIYNEKAMWNNVDREGRQYLTEGLKLQMDLAMKTISQQASNGSKTPLDVVQDRVEKALKFVYEELLGFAAMSGYYLNTHGSPHVVICGVVEAELIFFDLANSMAKGVGFLGEAVGTYIDVAAFGGDQHLFQLEMMALSIAQNPAVVQLLLKKAIQDATGFQIVDALIDLIAGLYGGIDGTIELYEGAREVFIQAGYGIRIFREFFAFLAEWKDFDGAAFVSNWPEIEEVMKVTVHFLDSDEVTSAMLENPELRVEASKIEKALESLGTKARGEGIEEDEIPKRCNKISP